MRGELNLSLPGTAVLQSKTAMADGQGGQTWTYSAAGTVDARLSPLGGGLSRESETALAG